MAYLPLVLQLLVSMAVFLIASKYLFGPVPADYHREIIEKDGGTILEGHRRVVTALYRSMGGAFCSSAIAVALIALLARDSSLSIYGIPLIVLAAAIPTAVVANRTERETGTRTPWRPAVILPLVAILASVVEGLV